MADTFLDKWWGLPGRRGERFRLIYSNPGVYDQTIFYRVLKARPNLVVDGIYVARSDEGVEASVVANVTLTGDVPNLGTTLPQTMKSGPEEHEAHELLFVFRRDGTASRADTAIRGTLDNAAEEVVEAVDRAIIGAGRTTQAAVDYVKPRLLGFGISLPVLFGVGFGIYLFGIRGFK